jgi:hypothetical protein
VVVEYCSGCCFCLMLRCEICILFHFSCFVVVVVLLLCCTYLFGWLRRFRGSVDFECVRVVVKVATRWLVEMYLDEVPNVF